MKKVANIDDVIADLSSSQWFDRKQAASLLGQIKDKRRVEPLITALADGQHLVKEQAAKSLGLTYSPKSIAPLIETLGDKNPGVRRQAAKSLGMLRDSSAVSALINTLDDTDEGVRWEAAESLVKIKQVEFNHINEYLVRRQSPAFQPTVWIVGELKMVEATPFLINSLNVRDVKTVRSSIIALGKIKNVELLG